jgi:hypothetical protein
MLREGGGSSRAELTMSRPSKERDKQRAELTKGKYRIPITVNYDPTRPRRSLPLGIMMSRLRPTRGSHLADVHTSQVSGSRRLAPGSRKEKEGRGVAAGSPSESKSTGAGPVLTGAQLIRPRWTNASAARKRRRRRSPRRDYPLVLIRSASCISRVARVERHRLQGHQR